MQAEDQKDVGKERIRLCTCYFIQIIFVSTIARAHSTSTPLVVPWSCLYTSRNQFLLALKSKFLETKTLIYSLTPKSPATEDPLQFGNSALKFEDRGPPSVCASGLRHQAP